MKKVKWSFVDHPTVFETEADKLETTVSLLRQKNWLVYDHPFQILNQETPATEVVSEKVEEVQEVKPPKAIEKPKRTRKKSKK